MELDGNIADGPAPGTDWGAIFDANGDRDRREFRPARSTRRT